MTENEKVAFGAGIIIGSALTTVALIVLTEIVVIPDEISHGGAHFDAQNGRLYWQDGSPVHD